MIFLAAWPVHDKFLTYGADSPCIDMVCMWEAVYRLHIGRVQKVQLLAHTWF